MIYFYILQIVFFFQKGFEYCLLSLFMFNEYYNRFLLEMWGGFFDSLNIFFYFGYVFVRFFFIC